MIDERGAVSDSSEVFLDSFEIFVTLFGLLTAELFFPKPVISRG
jgi:hypothetical protein